MAARGRRLPSHTLASRVTPPNTRVGSSSTAGTIPGLVVANRITGISLLLNSHAMPESNQGAPMVALNRS